MLQVMLHPQITLQDQVEAARQIKYICFFWYFVREVGLNNLVSCNSVLEHNIL